MTSKNVSIELLGEDAKAECANCGEEYLIKDSDAWNMQLYCSGACEIEDEDHEEETESNVGRKFSTAQDWLIHAVAEGTVDIHDLLSLIVSCVDADDIQDAFQKQMDVDGYFDEE
jgi:hypothetical protein